MTFDLLALPNEVVHNILATVRHDGIKGLSTLRLCSKRCKTHADQHFYHTIALRSHNDDSSQNLYCHRGDMCCEGHGRKMHGAEHVSQVIDQLLADEEAVCPHARHLIIGPWRWDEYVDNYVKIPEPSFFKDAEAKLNSKNIARIISKCKNLRDLSWNMSIEIPQEVSALLQTQHPNCRLHVAWRSDVNSDTDKTLFTLPQLTHIDLMIMNGTGSSDLQRLTRLLRDNEKIELFSVTRAGEKCPLPPRGWLFGWGKCLQENESVSFQTGLRFPALKHLRLGGWFLNSSDYVDSWVQATNWENLRSLNMGLYTPHHLLKKLRGKIPLLEHLELKLETARDADTASFPDSAVFMSHLVDFIAGAPSLVKLTFRVRQRVAWDLFWQSLPVEVGARLRDLRITFDEFDRCTHWTEDHLRGLVAKVPQLESLGVQLEVDRNHEMQTTSWPTASQAILAKLSSLRHLHLAVPLYGKDSAFSTPYDVGRRDHMIELDTVGAEKLVETVFNELSNELDGPDLQYLDVVFVGRGWSSSTRNWRFIVERDNHASCDEPPYTIKTIVLGGDTLKIQ